MGWSTVGADRVAAAFR